MSFALTLLFVLATTPFESRIDQAFNALQKNDWTATAAALDDAYAADAPLFAANNFHYLRGRVAETQGDWRRAVTEFKQVAQNNPLYVSALWHTARASAKLRDDTAALEYFNLLPQNFPRELKIQVAHDAGPNVALRIYQDVSTREARYERAKALGDDSALWTLIREGKDDDVALNASQVVLSKTTAANDQMALGEIFANHRQFDEALGLYQRAAADSTFAADARYRIARIHFQQEKYLLAIDDYRAIAKDYSGTDWEKDSEYQIASCYWRLADYAGSEKAYSSYIQKYGQTGMKEAATRNLIDVYRASGDNQKAILALDRALATKLSISTRQVFLFTKAKVLYLQKRYTAALTIFQQLARTKLRSAPGSATADEIQYFIALSQSKLGNKTAATAIWQKLAQDPLSYYGQRSAEKLGKDVVLNAGPACLSNSFLKSIEADVDGLRHSLRDGMDSAADAVSELIFLRLWDEAAFWMNWSNKNADRRKAAEIAYLAGEYDRSISLANRLPKTGATLPLFYPAGYGSLICDAAAKHKTDPLWLHAIIWQESKYDPTTRSDAGARGLMQFIPQTAGDVAASIGLSPITVEKLYDPGTSIQLGAAYWSSLMQKMKSPEMALAAYNGGPDNVERWRSKSPDPELFVSDIGFVETKKYVMLVFAARAAYGQLAN